MIFVILLFSLLLTLTYHYYSKFQFNENIIRNYETVENIQNKINLMKRKSQMDEKCFHYHIYDKRSILPNILEHRKQPRKDSKNIFFHETSCTRDGVLKLNARQACAIESAAKMNPDWDVFVLFSARVGFNNKTRLPLIDQLSSYPNIHLRHVNIYSYTKDTPIGEWMTRGVVHNSTYFAVHLSDTLRLVSLWKYGGTYMDLDVIVIKSLNHLKPNYAAMESDDFINGAVLNFDTYIGFDIVDMCLMELITTFNRDMWGGNGPELITRVLKRLCHTNELLEMNPSNCSGFQVLPQHEFYAVSYSDYKFFFNETTLEDVLLRTANSTLVHFWNYLTANEKVRVGSRVAYGVLANDYCHKVYSNCGEYF